MVSVPISRSLPQALDVSSQSLWCLSLSLSVSPLSLAISSQSLCLSLTLSVSPLSLAVSSQSLWRLSQSLSPPHTHTHTHLWLSLLNLYGVCPYLCRSLPCLFSISMVSACPCHCRSLACLFSISVVSAPTSLCLSPVSRGPAINNIFIHVFSVLSEPEENLYENTSFTPTTSL